jgi:hypothetical protein
VHSLSLLWPAADKDKDLALGNAMNLKKTAKLIIWPRATAMNAKKDFTSISQADAKQRRSAERDSGA